MLCSQPQTHDHALETADYTLFFLSLPVFRFLFVVESFRDLMFGLINAIPDFLSLFIVLGVLIYRSLLCRCNSSRVLTVYVRVSTRS